MGQIPTLEYYEALKLKWVGICTHNERCYILIHLLKSQVKNSMCHMNIMAQRLRNPSKR